MVLASGVVAKYTLGPVKSWVESAAYLIGPMFDIKTIYGWRKTDPFPDHPSGHALDFMIKSKSQGQAVADYAVANYQSLGVKYVIWNHQVWNPRQGWHPYTSTSNPHTDHVHVTFNDQPGTGTTLVGSTTPTLNASYDVTTCAWTVKFPVAGNTCLISNPQARVLAGMICITAGVIMALTGAVLITIYGLDRSGAAKYVPGVAKVVRSVG